MVAERPSSSPVRASANTPEQIVDVAQISPNGHRAAYIQIDFTARPDGDTLTGEGRAVVHGPDDSVIYGTDATTEVRRLP